MNLCIIILCLWAGVAAAGRRQQIYSTSHPYYATTTPIHGHIPSSGGFPLLPGGQIPVQHPNAFHYVGAGYNLVTGNPDGEFWNKAGDDPGLRITQKILVVSPVNSPPQLEIEHRDTCQTSHEYNLIYNGKTYQQRLMEGITSSGAADADLRPFAFTLSEGYKSIHTQTNKLHYVFQDYTTVCNIGHARFKLHLANAYHMSITREFAAAVCELPLAYNQSAYIKFIDEWGTHVITEVEVGKKMTMRYATRRNTYFSFLMNYTNPDVSKGGPLYGFPESLQLDLDTFKYRSAYRMLVGTFHDQLGTGNQYYNDEIELVISTLDMALKPDLWSYLPNFVQQGVCPSKFGSNMHAVQSNLLHTLRIYGGMKNGLPPPATPLAIPLVWPYGSYGLQKPQSGCPKQFTWSEGARTQGTSITNGPGQTHFASQTTSSSSTINFCVKERVFESEFNLFWPKGDYCIYKSGACPYGFKNGSIYFNEREDSSSGVLPDGHYGSDTLYDFCCRNDGSYLTDIFLPTEAPFYLFKNQHGCQHVSGLTVLEETMTIAAAGIFRGAYPATDTSPSAQTIHFCYYSKLQTPDGGVIG